MITKNHVSVGSSAGLFGLVVAYYLDYKNVTVKEWFVGITIVLLLIILLSWYSSSLYKEIFYKVDWASHLLGATSAAIYIRLFNKR